MSTLNLFEQLADELSQAILGGQLPGGSALPTLRAFAAERQIGLSTATRVYAELQRRGLVVGEVGRGSFVRERPIGPGTLAAAERYTAAGRAAEAVDASALRSALRTASGLSDLERLIAQPSPLGSPAVRQALAAHLAHLGLSVSPAQLVVTGGGLAASRLAALMTLRRGQWVATDAITYPGWRLIAEQYGLQLAPVLFDRHGPLPDSLERLLKSKSRSKRITALHAMPSAHHPLGWVMPLQRRLDIVALARAHGLALLEDVTYIHLLADAPPTLAALAPERTWLVGSLSGMLGDGLRLGFVVAPARQEATLEKTARAWGLTAPPVVAELARLWLADGTLKSLQDAQRLHAGQLWAAVGAAGLAAHSPSCGGWWLWLPVRRGYRHEEAVSVLRHQGIDVLGSEAFAVTPSQPNAIVLRLRVLTPQQLAAMAPALLAACQ